jgi:hypothetical protein
LVVEAYRVTVRGHEDGGRPWVIPTVAWRGDNRGNRFTGPGAPWGPGKTNSHASKEGLGRPSHALQKGPGKW